MPSEKFERQIRKKLAGAQKAPPPGLFEAIQAELNPAPAPPRRAFAWWWLSGGLLATAAIAAILWLSFPSPPAPAAATDPLIAHPLPRVPVKEPPVLPQPEPLAQTGLPDTGSGQTASSAGSSGSTVDTEASAMSSPEVAEALVPTQVRVAAPTTPPMPPKQAPAARRIAAVPIGPLALGARQMTIPAPAQGFRPIRPEGAPYYLRLLMQVERASRGNPLLLLKPPVVDHSLVETDQRFITPNVGQVHVLNYPKQRLALGALIGRRVSPRVSLETGLLYSHSEEGVYQRGVTDPSLFSDGGTPAQEAVRQYNLELRWRQSYLELPLRAIVHLWRGSGQSLSVMGGLALNRNVQRIEPNNAQYFRASDETVNQTSDQPYLDLGGNLVTTTGAPLLGMRTWHSQAQTGFIYAVDWGANRRLYVSPTFKYLLRGAYEGSAALDQMRYHLGLEVGMQWGSR